MVVNQNFSFCMEQNVYENLESNKHADEAINYYLQKSNFIPKDNPDFMVKKGYKIEKVIGAGHSGITFLAISTSGDKCILKYAHSMSNQSFCPSCIGVKEKNFKIDKSNNLTSLIYGKDEDCILTFVKDLIGYKNYHINNQTLHNDILNLKNARTLEKLLQKINELKID